MPGLGGAPKLGLGIVWLVQLPFGLAELWAERQHDIVPQGYVEFVIGNFLGLGAAVGLFQGLSRTALEQPDPPSWAYVLMANHPTIMQRIAMVKAWEGRRGPAPSGARP